MKHPQLLAIALVAAGCGPLVTEPMPDIPETVEYDTVRIEYGEDDLVAGTANQPLTPQALIGDASVMAALAKGLVGGTNQIIHGQFALIDAVTQHAPTSWDEGLWVWDNTEFKRDDERFSRFEISEIDEGRYGYLWLVGNRPAEMLEIFSGEFTPQTREDGRQRGYGKIRFNFDNIHAVDPETDAPKGRAAIAFRAVGGVRQVRVATFDLVEHGKTEKTSALYEYVQFRNRGGRFKFGTRVDWLKDADPLEVLAVDAVWTASTEGRALARLSGGSLTINEVLAEECWGANGRMTFADLTPDMPAVPYEDGMRESCAAGLLEFELDPPAYTPPETEPAVPGPHADEEG